MGATTTFLAATKRRSSKLVVIQTGRRRASCRRFQHERVGRVSSSDDIHGREIQQKQPTRARCHPLRASPGTRNTTYAPPDPEARGRMSLAPKSAPRAPAPRARVPRESNPFSPFTKTSPRPFFVSPSLLLPASRRARTNEADGRRRVATRCAPTFLVGAAGALRTLSRAPPASRVWNVNAFRLRELRPAIASSDTSSKHTERPSSRRISSVPQNASSARCSACDSSTPRSRRCVARRTCDESSSFSSCWLFC
jgi:hypothetical protein